MYFLFPSAGFDPSIPDLSFRKEFSIALDFADSSYLLDIDKLCIGQYAAALRRLPLFEGEAKPFLYRGWMLNWEAYQGLDTALREKNAYLINSTKQYLACHEMFAYYPYLAKIENCTPKTLFLNSSEGSERMFTACQNYFGQPPSTTHSLFLKGNVSSEKYYWKEACLISDFRNKENFNKVVSSFLEKQKEFRGQVQNPLVFREFIPLRNIGYHKIGIPYSQEFRSFIYKGSIISTHKYWAEQEYLEDRPSNNWLKKVAKIIYKKTGNSFFTLDSAQTEQGNWIIIEVGDGQVSSIQDDSHLPNVYGGIFHTDELRASLANSAK